MRVFLLATLACLFLVAPPAARPILCLGIAFVMSAGLVDMLRDGKRIAQRRSMLNAQFRDHAAAITSARRGNVRPQGSFKSCFR